MEFPSNLMDFKRQKSYWDINYYIFVFFHHTQMQINTNYSTYEFIKSTELKTNQLWVYMKRFPNCFFYQRLFRIQRTTKHLIELSFPFKLYLNWIDSILYICENF